MNTIICRLILCTLSLLLGALQGQQFRKDSSLAKILQEQRFNLGNGKFGHAAQQEDGTEMMVKSTRSNMRLVLMVLESLMALIFHLEDKNAAAAVVKENGEIKEYDYEYYDSTLPESPFVNPHDPTHHKPMLLAGNLAGHLAALFETPPSTIANPLSPKTTPLPRRNIFPPGQLQLDRFTNGFNFKFKSQ
ncbi:unnamed protein product [Lepeophtheirus salmonis]|uniref:(salmon louse) hypothetical protein n=1 Tax=Lepeophtheirus salmonis TaxID=72036 RepID=A0A7R8CW05_LEPSM|nr:unnamed protein product [Lepeophtheirus salmonis]CAF2949372.1 unnamed protein product [Lepeophtheirus salmonis]